MPAEKTTAQILFLLLHVCTEQEMLCISLYISDNKGILFYSSAEAFIPNPHDAPCPYQAELLFPSELL